MIRLLPVALVLILGWSYPGAAEVAVAQVEIGIKDVDHDAITIWSGGVRLAGDIYKPKDIPDGTKLPGILLVHGWGGSKAHLQRAYGPQFAALGFIVLAFDFKGWGESDGPLLLSEPLPAATESTDITLTATHIRNVVNPLSMLEDTRAALHYLGGEKQVMPDNIGIWGTSLGGGLAMVTAVNDERIKAFVDQIGAVNFKANLETISERMARGWETQAARGEIPPYPGPEAVVNPALKGFPDWVAMKRFDPFAVAEQITIPTLIIDAEDEELFPREKNGRKLHAALKDKVDTRYVVLPGKHYDIYRGEAYKKALQEAQDWFVMHLKGSEIGPLLYKEHCADCHSNPAARAPAFSALKAMSKDKLTFSMTEGKMKLQSAALSPKEKAELVSYLAAGVEDPHAWEASMACEKKAPSSKVIQSAAVSGWGYGIRNQRFQAATQAGLTANDLPKLELAWAQGFPGATEMRSQPVVTDDTVYIGIQEANSVYAFDLASGCLKWAFRGPAPVRSSLGFGQVPNAEGVDEAVLFYGDVRGGVHMISASDGSKRWSVQVDMPQASITGSPVLHANKLFVPLSSLEVANTMRANYECCTAHGGVVALDAQSGSTLWTYHTTAEAKPRGKSKVGTPQWGPSGAPVWTTPAIDIKRNRLYIGTGENYSHPATKTSDAIIALDLDTGKKAWSFQALANDVYNQACLSYLGFPDLPNCPKDYGPDFDFGASVVIASDGKGNDLLLAGQKSGDVYALNPDKKGKLVWHRRVAGGTPVGGIHWGMSLAQDTLFVPIADPDWSITRWDYAAKPGLVALDVASGKKKWRHKAERGCELDPANFNAARNQHTSAWPDCHFYYGFSGAATSINGAVIAGDLGGRVNAFSADNGELIWQLETNRSFDTLNGVKAHGGALDNAGPVIANGHLILQSGYSYFNQMPGNVLLVYKLK